MPTSNDKNPPIKCGTGVNTAYIVLLIPLLISLVLLCIVVFSIFVIKDEKSRAIFIGFCVFLSMFISPYMIYQRIDKIKEHCSKTSE